MESKLYYEAHITIEPVKTDDLLDDLRIIAGDLGFKVANLLMMKRPEATLERSPYDTFLTGHGKSYSDIEDRLKRCVRILQKNGFKVYRYKIEDTLIDSRTDDKLNLL